MELFFFDLGYDIAQKSFENFILNTSLDLDQIILENRDYKSELLIYHQKKDSKN